MMASGRRWGEHPMAAVLLPGDSHSVKGIPRKKALTLGAFIVAVYDAYGRRRACGIIRRAANAHIVVFSGARNLIVSHART